MSDHETRWRRSDTLSGATLLVVAGWIWWASGHVNTWNIVADPSKGNEALDHRLTVIETQDRDFEEEVLRRLASIDKKMDHVKDSPQ